MNSRPATSSFFSVLAAVLFIIYSTCPNGMCANSPASSNHSFIQKFEKALESRNRFTVGYYLSKIAEEPLSETDYLHLIKKASTPSNPPCFVNSLVNEMDENFPHLGINRYLFEDGAIKGDGVKFILAEKAPTLSKQTAYHVSNSYADLGKEVERAMTTDKSHGIFFHDGEDAEHWTLIHIDKHLKKEICSVQIFDAVGHPQTTTISMAIKKKLPRNCVIHTEKHRRQSDGINCSVFALHDFLELEKQTILSPEFYSGLRVEDCLNPRSHANGVNISPHLMSLTQSFSTIRKYTAEIESKHTSGEIEELLGKISHATLTLPKLNNDTTRKELEELASIDPKDKSLTSKYLDSKSKKQFPRLIDGEDEDPYHMYSEFCEGELPLYFSTEKEMRLNTGAKTQHDSYVEDLINHAIKSAKK
ncbi:MAG: hypothetical protein ABIQ95_15710 [Bdellovibrionia bacterium]